MPKMRMRMLHICMVVVALAAPVGVAHADGNGINPPASIAAV